jgi:hypothetical protein
MTTGGRPDGLGFPPPFLPSPSAEGGGERAPLRAPGVYPVYVPPDDGAGGSGGGSPSVPSGVDVSPGLAEVHRERLGSVHQEQSPTLAEALGSIREVVDDLRRFAGEAAQGNPEMATWFSVRRSSGAGPTPAPAAPLASVAAEAARHLEVVAQRVRAGELPLLEVNGPLREGAALALTLAALQGARSPSGGARGADGG